MDLSITNPLALILLLLLPLFWWIGRQGLAYMRPLRRHLALGLRIAFIALLVLSFAGFQTVSAVNNLALVFLVDRSDSVDAATQARELEFVRNAISKMGGDDRAAVVFFAADAVVEQPMSPASAYGSAPLAQPASVPLNYYTDIEGAVRLGLALFPAEAQKRLVIVSDGNETSGHAEQAAQLAVASGAGISAVNVGTRPGNEMLISDMQAPAFVRQGEQFELNITIHSSVETSATLRLYSGDSVQAVVPVQLKKGDNRFSREATAQQRGFATFRADLQPSQPTADSAAQNNTYSAFTFIQGQPSVLLIEGHNGEATPLLSALRAASITVNLIAVKDTPVDLRELARYDSVVLDNVPASSLPPGAMETMQSYVRDLGRGLVAVGGQESFALGGYFRTPLEATLPVDMSLPNRLAQPNTAIEIVIDHSGSMDEVADGGARKIDLAKQAADQTVTQLGTDDSLGVVIFDDQVQELLPLSPVDDVKRIQGIIGGITPGGGTDIHGGLAPGVNALANSGAKSKAVILLTDGVDGNSNVNYDDLIRLATANNITITTIGVGPIINTDLLSSLAKQTGGRFYHTNSGANLPQIFTSEAHLAARSYLNQRQFTPQLSAPSPILKGLKTLPDLYGYVATTTKPLASLVLASDSGDPILAAWQYGLGRAIAWTSDAQSNWAKNWVSWPDFSTFWAQAVRWTMPGQTASSLQPRVTINGANANITVDAIGGGGDYINGLDMAASVLTPGKITDTLTLRQSAPGRYVGEFPAAQSGVYLIAVRAAGEVSSTVTVNGAPTQHTSAFSETETLGLAVPYPAEYRDLEPNTALLQRLITTGLSNLQPGQGAQKLLTLSDGPTALLAHNLIAASAGHPLWPLFLILAILLLPFDIAVRRVMIGGGELRQLFAAITGRQPRAAFAPAATPMQPLFNARRHAREQQPPPPVSNHMPVSSDNPITRPSPLAAPLDTSSTIDAAAPPSDSLAARLRQEQERRRQG